MSFPNPFEFTPDICSAMPPRHGSEIMKPPTTRTDLYFPPPLHPGLIRTPSDNLYNSGKLTGTDSSRQPLTNLVDGISEIPDEVSISLPNYSSSLPTTSFGTMIQQPTNGISHYQTSNIFSHSEAPSMSEDYLKADSHREAFNHQSSGEFSMKPDHVSSGESRFHSPASGMPAMNSLPSQKSFMRSIYGQDVTSFIGETPTPSMYTYFQPPGVDEHSKTTQFYRHFQPPFASFNNPPELDEAGQFSKEESRGFSMPTHNNSRTAPSERKQTSSSHGPDSRDVEEVENTNRCKNTVEGTKTSVRRFKKWYKDKYGKSIDMNKLGKTTAVEMLKDFFIEIRDTRPGKEGNEYEPVTLTTYRNGLRRYFLERKVPPAVDNFDLADREFDMVNFQLVTKRNDLKRKGKGNHPNVVESITEEQLERMWATGAIGVHAPRPLLRLQWWINTVSHGIRGRMAHHDLSIDDFRISRGPDGKIVIDYAKAGSKRPRAGEDDKETSRSKKKCKARVAATDGGERDPVRAFEVYLRHRPPGISSFYLTPKHKPKGDIWFNKVPMGKNSIGRIMREIKAIAGIG